MKCPDAELSWHLVGWACISGPLFLCFYFPFKTTTIAKAISSCEYIFCLHVCEPGGYTAHRNMNPEEGIEFSITRLTHGY